MKARDRKSAGGSIGLPWLLSAMTKPKLTAVPMASTPMTSLDSPSELTTFRSREYQCRERDNPEHLANRIKRGLDAQDAPYPPLRRRELLPRPHGELSLFDLNGSYCELTDQASAWVSDISSAASARFPRTGPGTCF